MKFPAGSSHCLSVVLLQSLPVIPHTIFCIRCRIRYLRKTEPLPEVSPAVPVPRFPVIFPDRAGSEQPYSRAFFLFWQNSLQSCAPPPAGYPQFRLSAALLLSCSLCCPYRSRQGRFPDFPAAKSYNHRVVPVFHRFLQTNTSLSPESSRQHPMSSAQTQSHTPGFPAFSLLPASPGSLRPGRCFS